MIAALEPACENLARNRLLFEPAAAADRLRPLLKSGAGETSGVS